ncbi:hypothetical protein DQ04_05691020 [Trypanosoma grayi]|uniref:hypothetical protein n=1 Tax=Trypanosoma grayi TaxID=71804 RepID=UPI0004F440DA|nr:hypothetical protein DQ04_05691020 [Trypanosoma grayi]KEG09166.1 hypothetical protein DQ04_05691020 [Trypanosoma grayi]
MAKLAAFLTASAASTSRFKAVLSFLHTFRTISVGFFLSVTVHILLDNFVTATTTNRFLRLCSSRHADTSAAQGKYQQHGAHHHHSSCSHHYCCLRVSFLAMYHTN